MGRGARKAGRGAASTSIVTDLGSRIRAERNRIGLTQAQLGAPSYDASYISSLENGHHVPSLEALELVAHNLGLAPGDLLGGPAPATNAAAAIAQTLHAVRREIPNATPARREALVGVELVLRLALPTIAADTN